MRNTLKNLIPKPLFTCLIKIRNEARIFRNRHTPTEKIFTKIYQHNTWGGQPGEYSSGGGTVDPAIADPYVDCLSKLARKLRFAELNAVDLGCGDMRIGKRISPLFASYTGVDIVRDLITHHQENHSVNNVSFEHLNIIEAPLPKGDVCLIRQVLQHLSNEQIQKVLAKLTQYKYVIITEHLPTPNPEIIKNLDIPHGSDIRLIHNSGVYLTAPPFLIPEGAVKQVLAVEGYGGVVKTFLYQPNTGNSPG